MWHDFAAAFGGALIGAGIMLVAIALLRLRAGGDERGWRP
jgi:hypothetical protein